MDIHGYPWISMDINEYQWISTTLDNGTLKKPPSIPLPMTGHEYETQSKELASTGYRCVRVGIGMGMFAAPSLISMERLSLDSTTLQLAFKLN